MSPWHSQVSSRRSCPVEMQPGLVLAWRLDSLRLEPLLSKHCSGNRARVHSDSGTPVFQMAAAAKGPPAAPGTKPTSGEVSSTPAEQYLPWTELRGPSPSEGPWATAAKVYA